MTTPGRQAAIEAAAKALWETGREPNPLVRAWDRTENEAGKDETRRIVTAAITAYERVLAEQPREERAKWLYDRHVKPDGFCDCEFPNWCLFEAGYKAAQAERPRGEEGLRDALHREKLSRALGLAQSIAQAPPYPLSMDGVRDVAGEIASLLSAALNAEEHPDA